ncbi:MAG: RNA methyltransferase [Bacteroidetes bacterium]|nr:MAG: RNA methyltransferase [Bacteroidota bacterium]
MLSSSKIKWIRSLSQKKYRKQEGFFVAEGDKIVKELLDSTLEVRDLYATESWAADTVFPQGLNPQIVNSKELERISSLNTPNQALAVVKIPVKNPASIQLKGHFTLVLDNIQDPGNLGTIIRTADWFGIRNIVCSVDTAELYNPKVIQATMGSFMRVNVLYTQLDEFLLNIPANFPVIGAMLEGENLFKTTMPSEGIVVMGNESKGISQSIQDLVTSKIFIPRGSENKEQPESLNAAVAAGIILSQLSK